MTTSTMTRPASDKQVELIERLLAEREITADGPYGGESTETIIRNAAADIREASNVIACLFRAPRKAGATRPAPGIYVLGEEIVKVQPNKAGTNTYAKRLMPSGNSKRGTWEYVPGLIDRLAGATPATAEDMAAYGHRTGTCGICGALLTDPESIERGIGPICASRI